MTSLVVVLTLLACGACGGRGAANKGNKLTFVTAKGTIQWWPVEFGSEQGIFKHAGLDVKTVQAKSGPEITSILTSGSADVGMGVLDAAVTPIKQGGDIRILDIPGVLSSTSVIVAPDTNLRHTDGGYPKEATDLEGLKIGVTALGSPVQAYLTTVLQEAGVSPKDVTPVAVGPPSTAIPAFTEGKVDALVAYDPMTQMLGHKNYRTVVSSEDMLGHVTGPANSVYFLASQGFAHSHKAHVFCTAIQRVYAAIKDPAHKRAAVKSLSSWTGLRPEQSVGLLTSVRKSMGRAVMDRATWREAKSFLSTAPPKYGDAVTEVCG